MKLVLERALIFHKAQQNEFVNVFKMYIKGLRFSPAGTGAGEESGGRVAALADLCGDFSIVCLCVCSAPCQAAGRDRCMSRVAAS